MMPGEFFHRNVDYILNSVLSLLNGAGVFSSEKASTVTMFSVRRMQI